MRPPAVARVARMQMRSRRQSNGCLVWTGRLNLDGYGRIRVGDRTAYVHRVAWQVANGSIPAGLTIDHLCRNRACIETAHMELVTNRENVLRGALHRIWATGRCRFGHPLDGRQKGGRLCMTCRRASRRRSRSAALSAA